MNSFNGLLAAAATSLAVIAAPAAHAACQDCATVIELKTVKKAGEGSGLGAVLGGVAGGVVGHQIGSGRGNDVATVAGAAGGAYAGHQIEKNRKSTTSHHVIVKLDEGGTRTFTFPDATSYRVGDKVKIVGKRLARR